MKELRNVIRALYKKKIINYQDYSFYSFLSLLISDWEIDNIRLSIDSAKNIFTGDRLELIDDIHESFSVSDVYQGTSDYYVKALVSLNLLQY